MISDKTVAFLAAYVYGVRFDPTPFIEVCRKHNLDFIEDAAEVFEGTKTFVGHPEADLTFFSFGLIKVQTCVNGSVTVVRNDQSLYKKMADINATYPVQTKQLFLQKTMKALAGKLILQTRLGYRLCYMAFNKFAKDREVATINMARGFTAQDDFLGKFRIQPGACMLHFLHERLSAFDHEKFRRDMEQLHKIQDILLSAGFFVPGSKIKNRNFWLFPVMIENKELFKEYMLLKGVVPFSNSSQMSSVKPHSSKYKPAPHAEWYKDRLLGLPLHPAVPKEV